MPQIWTVILAAVVSFAISSAWYVAFGGMLARLSPAYAEDRRMPPWMGLVELLRSAVVAVVVGLAVDRLGIDGFGGLVVVALVAWVGFPVVLLSGSVLHEGVPWRLAAVHAGDWLLKLVAVTLIVGLWG
jgi:Protein of unknown function (DUF1761)